MKDYDERAWELEVVRCDDGDLLLAQGNCPCGCGEEVLIRLNPAHFTLMAGHMALVPAAEVGRARERLRDRLTLLAAMVMAHTREGDPLRAAVGCLLRDEAVPKTALLSGPENGTLRAETVPKSGQLPLEMPNATRHALEIENEQR